MRVPISWLNECLSEALDAGVIRDTLTRIGLEVESLAWYAPGLETVIVGQIVDIAPHPNADKLRVCQTDLGQGQRIQIVTGASNVACHDKVPVALVGSMLPGGKAIGHSKLRGVDSFGMYCSLAELGLPDDGAGVMVLPPDTPIGQPIADALQLGVQMLDLAVTANRPDALGVIGVARELVVAHSHLQLRPPALPRLGSARPSIEGNGVSPIVVRCEAEAACPLYGGLILRNVTPGVTPDWLRDRLTSIGLRSIHIAVDLTNYLMWLTGQPLHVFDADKIAGGSVVIRQARPGETVVTLDGVTRALDEQDLVIADCEKVLAIAGVMGGLTAAVDEHTKSLFLEAAYFSPSGVRRTSRRLGLGTDSSYRFERGVDPSSTLDVLIQLRDGILDLMGGEQAGSLLRVARADFPSSVQFSFGLDAVDRLLGVDISQEEAERILRGLGFVLKPQTADGAKRSVYDVVVPGWRCHDVSSEADLVEEVGRHWGYDNIPPVLPPVIHRPVQHPRMVFERKTRELLSSWGFREVVTRSLTTPEAEAMAGVRMPRYIALAHPLKDMTVMRSSLLPSLLEVLRHNRYQGQGNMGVYEFGRTYTGQSDGSVVEQLWLGGAWTGSLWQGMWRGDHAPEPLKVDWASIKGLVESLIERMHRRGEVSFEAASDVEGFHPGRCARIRFNALTVGVVGELHPQVMAAYDLNHGLNGAAWLLDFDLLVAQDERPLAFQPFSRQPAALRDLAVIVPESLESDAVLGTIRQVGGAWLERVSLFDRYQSEGLGEAKVSLAFNLSYRHPERTLSTEEVECLQREIVNALTTQFGAELRA